MVKKDWNALLDESDGYIVLFQKGGDVKAQLDGNYQVIFDRIFDSEQKHSEKKEGREPGR